MTAIFLDQAEETDRHEARLIGLAFTFLTLTALAFFLAPVVRLGDWSFLGSRVMHFVVLPVWFGGTWLIRRELKRVCPTRDPLLLPSAFLLVGWGMLLIWRLAPTFGARQTSWFMVGVSVMLVILRGPANLHWLRRYRYLWLTAGVTLTALTLFLGTNPSGGEPRLWLGCCGFYLQPSEPLRLLLIAFLASFLADRLIFRWSDQSPPWLPTLAPLLVVWGLSVALLVVQRDLGTGTLFLAILALLLYLISGRWQVLLIAGGFSVLGGLLGNLLFEVVRVRLAAWVNPWIDPTGGSYQLVQSLIAIASGGVFGRGPGLGSPGFVPVIHSDFVFAAVSEEWGLLGGLAMIALFAVLVTRGLHTAYQCKDSFSMILAAGLAVAIGLQAIVIMAGTTRMLPLAGVTLPFVSYGGSSLVTSFIALAFLLLLSGGNGNMARFAKPIRNIQAGMTMAWVGLALVIGWWSVVRAPALTSRSDNPRRALAQLFSRRGSVFDEGGQLLAGSVGERGEYSRNYPDPWAGAVVGFDSLIYGQSGVEESMDLILRGEAGYPEFTIWSEHLLTGNPPPGLDVRLTIDTEEQAMSVEALSTHTGAVVILETLSGEIRALASSPFFDPNLLDQEWSALIEREDAPLLNRATQGLYQPGMAITPMLLAWTIEKEGARINDPIPDPSSLILFDGGGLQCADEGSSLGTLDLGLALRLGCPSPFADLGVLLGSDEFSEMIRSFGLVQPIAIKLEVAPMKRFIPPLGEEAVSLEAIGQGDLTVTPLHMARAFSVLIGDGVLPSLKLVDAIEDSDGNWRTQSSPEPAGEFLSPDTRHEVIKAMQAQSGTLISFTAQAISGSLSGSIVWFFGTDRSVVDPRLVVMILEDSTPTEARSIGLKLINEIGSTSPSP